MSVLRVQNVVYVVEDLDRAEAFYRDVLELPLRFRDGDRWAQFALGPSGFALSSRAEAGHGARGGVAVLEVTELDAARGLLEAASAPVLSERDMGAHGRTLAFRDSEGNIAHLIERRQA